MDFDKENRAKPPARGTKKDGKSWFVS